MCLDGKEVRREMQNVNVRFQSLEFFVVFPKQVCDRLFFS